MAKILFLLAATLGFSLGLAVFEATPVEILEEKLEAAPLNAMKEPTVPAFASLFKPASPQIQDWPRIVSPRPKAKQEPAKHLTASTAIPRPQLLTDFSSNSERLELRSRIAERERPLPYGRQGVLLVGLTVGLGSQSNRGNLRLQVGSHLEASPLLVFR